MGLGGRLLQKLCSHCWSRGVRVGGCVGWTLGPLTEELKISMVELGVGRHDCQDGKVTR